MATGGAVYICVNFLCICARLAEWFASQDLSAHFVAFIIFPFICHFFEF
jgi:hypothetical protein